MKKLARGQAQRLTQSYHANHTRLTLHLPLIKKKKNKTKKTKNNTDNKSSITLEKMCPSTLEPPNSWPPHAPID